MDCLICSITFDKRDIEIESVLQIFCDLLSLNSSQYEAFYFSSDFFCSVCLDHMIHVSNLLTELQIIQEKLAKIKNKVQEEILQSHQESLKLKGTGNEKNKSLQKIRNDICIALSLLPPTFDKDEEVDFFDNDDNKPMVNVVIKTEDDTEYESESSYPNSPYESEENLNLISLKEKALKNDSILKIKRLEDLTTQELEQAFSDSHSKRNQKSQLIQDEVFIKEETEEFVNFTEEENDQSRRSENESNGSVSNINQKWPGLNKSKKPNKSTSPLKKEKCKYPLRKTEKRAEFEEKRNLEYLNQNDKKAQLEAQKEALKFALTCRVCLKKFKTSQIMKDHHSEAHNNQIIKCPDPICLKMFRTAKLRNKHFKRSHLGIPEYVVKLELCPICGKELKSNYMKTHLKIHEDRKFECKICNKNYISESGFETHNRIFHSGTERDTFMCHTCGKVLGSLGSLKQHEETVHEKLYKFKCDLCQGGAQTSEGLKRHKLTHLDERTFECPEPGCGRKYKNIGGLRLHKLVHTGERPHKCKICGKGFRASNHVKVHETLHTPYITTCACEICGKKYTHKHYLGLHYIWHRQVEARGNGPPQRRKKRKPITLIIPQ